MKVRYIVNNYQKGAKLKTCPTHKIIDIENIDNKHTSVIFDVNEREIEFINKVLFANNRVGRLFYNELKKL